MLTWSLDSSDLLSIPARVIRYNCSTPINFRLIATPYKGQQRTEDLSWRLLSGFSVPGDKDTTQLILERNRALQPGYQELIFEITGCGQAPKEQIFNLQITSAKKTIIDVTYQHLTELIAARELQPHQKYRLVDYRTRQVVAGQEQYYWLEEIEPLFLTATGIDQLSLQAESELYPQDTIHYQVFDERFGADRGRIIFRRDNELQLATDFDFRGVKIYTKLLPINLGYDNHQCYWYYPLANSRRPRNIKNLNWSHPGSCPPHYGYVSDNSHHIDITGANRSFFILQPGQRMNLAGVEQVIWHQTCQDVYLAAGCKYLNFQSSVNNLKLRSSVVSATWPNLVSDFDWGVKTQLYHPDYLNILDGSGTIDYRGSSLTYNMVANDDPILNIMGDQAHYWAGYFNVTAECSQLVINYILGYSIWPIEIRPKGDLILILDQQCETGVSNINVPGGKIILYARYGDWIKLERQGDYWYQIDANTYDG